MNPVEVDSDEDDNEQGDTNNQTQAGSETPEDSGGSVETSTESGVMKIRPSQQRSLKGKREKLQLQAGHGVPETGRKRSNQGKQMLESFRRHPCEPSKRNWRGVLEALTYANKNVVYLFF